MACCSKKVDAIEVFPYLGILITLNGSSDRDVHRRLSLVWDVMSALGRRMWRTKHLSQETKVEIYQRLVLPVLLCCKTWALTASLKSWLDSFRTYSLRWTLGYQSLNFVSNDRLLE